METQYLETVRNTFPDLFWGYTAIWILLGLYIVYLGFRLARLEKRVRDNGGKDK